MVKDEDYIFVFVQGKEHDGGLVVSGSLHRAKGFHEGDQVPCDLEPILNEFAEATKVGGSMAEVVADHMVVERVRDGGFKGAGNVLDEGVGVLEGEIVIIVDVVAFLVIVLGFVEPGGVDSMGLAVFFREIRVYGLIVFFLVRFFGLDFCFSGAIASHSILSG